MSGQVIPNFITSHMIYWDAPLERIMKYMNKISYRRMKYIHGRYVSSNKLYFRSHYKSINKDLFDIWLNRTIFKRLAYKNVIELILTGLFWLVREVLVDLDPEFKNIYSIKRALFNDFVLCELLRLCEYEVPCPLISLSTQLSELWKKVCQVLGWSTTESFQTMKANKEKLSQLSSFELRCSSDLPKLVIQRVKFYVLHPVDPTKEYEYSPHKMDTTLVDNILIYKKF